MRTGRRDFTPYALSASAFAASVFGLLLLRQARAQLDELLRRHDPFLARLPDPQAFREISAVAAPPPSAPAGTFDVLGFHSEKLIMGNFSNGRTDAVRDVLLEMPPGTTDVLAMMKGFVLAYGQTEADNETIQPTDDHHLAVEAADVGVLLPLDFGQNKATIRAVMLLRDADPADRWTGWILFQVIFLGHRTSA
jgi:hypothetical protein